MKKAFCLVDKGTGVVLAFWSSKAPAEKMLVRMTARFGDFYAITEKAL